MQTPKTLQTPWLRRNNGVLQCENAKNNRKQRPNNKLDSERNKMNKPKTNDKKRKTMNKEYMIYWQWKDKHNPYGYEHKIMAQSPKRAIAKFIKIREQECSIEQQYSILDLYVKTNNTKEANINNREKAMYKKIHSKAISDHWERSETPID